MKYLVDIPPDNDAALNLATEEYILRNLDIGHDYVLLYVNQPAVVIGRHQNIYEEVNLPFTFRQNIPVYRRISGGGTVYHDPGNLNFSFITRYEKFKFNNYRYFNEPIIDFLNKMGVPARHSDRNDMLIHDKKFSGNAQFTSRDRMVSHGTLLYNADLKSLSSALEVSQKEITSRATKSRRSPVTNLSDYFTTPPAISEFRESLISHLFQKDGATRVLKLEDHDLKKIKQLAAEKYRQWEWTYGESPDSTLQASVDTPDGKISCTMEVSKGRIKNLTFKGLGISESEAETLGNLFFGQRLYPKDISGVLKQVSFLEGEALRYLNDLFF